MDEVFEKISVKWRSLLRAVDHQGEVLETVVAKFRNKAVALKSLKKMMKRYGCADQTVTDRFALYKAALREMGALDNQKTGRWLNKCLEKSQVQFRRKESAIQRF